jgi:hypothetical protein
VLVTRGLYLGLGHHFPATLIFLPTPPHKPSSESYSSSIGLWMTNSVSLGSSLTFSSGPLTCSCLIDPPYFQAVFVKTWPTFLCINLRCHYYPDPHLRMLPLSTLWQTRDLGVTCCHSNRTISNNQSSASRRQSYLSLPSLPQTLMRHSIPSRSRCFFVSRTSGTPKI